MFIVLIQPFSIMNRGDKVKLIEIYLSDEQTHACSRNIFYAGRKYDDGAMAIKFVTRSYLKLRGGNII